MATGKSGGISMGALMDAAKTGKGGKVKAAVKTKFKLSVSPLNDHDEDD